MNSLIDKYNIPGPRYTSYPTVWIATGGTVSRIFKFNWDKPYFGMFTIRLLSTGNLLQEFILLIFMMRNSGLQ